MNGQSLRRMKASHCKSTSKDTTSEEHMRGACSLILGATRSKWIGD